MDCIRILCYRMRKNSAFTLAEVLITLGIIGVVAAMTIPTLMTKQNERVTITKVQKAYSILSQAFQTAVAENGDPSTWNLPLELSLANSVTARDLLLASVKASVKCSDSNSQASCGINPRYKRLGSNSNDAFVPAYSASLMTADGMGISVWVNEERYAHRGDTPALNHTLGFVNVDINGTKGPNTQGKDYFLFYISDLGIIPVGTKEETKSAGKAWDCYSSGRGCTAWVVKEKNMNYLHSKKCSWDNPSCQ